MNASSNPSWKVTPSPGLQLNSVAVSPDGQLSLCGTSNEFSTGQFGLFCYDGSGNLVWQQSVTGPDATQGVFWVALSDDKRFAAAGGESAKDVGFLAICDAASGAVLLSDANLPGRVNQLSFSRDGTLLLAAFSNALRLYRLQTDGYFALSSTTPISSEFDCISALLADDGSRVWLAAINYNTTPYSGLVQSFPVNAGLFGSSNSYKLSAGAMRIAVSTDGNYAAAALHSGGCALFNCDQPSTPKWTYLPPLANLSLAYAVAITQTSAGKVVVACGANQSKGTNGYLYVVDSVPSNSEIACPPQWMPHLRWSTTLQYSANPGVSLDREATKVTATDGKPSEEMPEGSNPSTSSAQESPGNFYLFDAIAGSKIWQYPTRLMNWPMVITPDGNTALGGSDDGSMYYWDLD